MAKKYESGLLEVTTVSMTDLRVCAFNSKCVSLEGNSALAEASLHLHGRMYSPCFHLYRGWT